MRRILVGAVALLLAGGTFLGLSVGTAGARVTSSTKSVSAPCTSASYSLVLSVTGTSFWTVSVNGQVDFTNDAATANIAFPTSFPIAALAGDDLQGTLVNGTGYVSVPAALSSYVNGDSWVSVALPSSVNTIVGSLFRDFAIACGNSQSVITLLAPHHGRGSTTALGNETINGVNASGTLFSQRAESVVGALKLKKLLGNKGLAPLSRVVLPVNVWSNPNGQLSEISTTLDSATPVDGLSGFSLTLDITNIDQPLSISAPTGSIYALSWSMLGNLGAYL